MHVICDHYYNVLNIFQNVFMFRYIEFYFKKACSMYFIQINAQAFTHISINITIHFSILETLNHKAFIYYDILEVKLSHKIVIT